MGNGPQQTPIYTSDDLDFINRLRNQKGLAPIDEFGVEVSGQPFTVAPPTPRTVTVPETPVEDQAPIVEEIKTFGAPEPLQPSIAQQEREARRAFEKSIDKVYQANLQDLIVRGGYKNIPELRDLTVESPDFQSRITEYARKEALKVAEGESGLVPGFAYAGFAPEGQQMKFPERIAGIIPTPAPAPPAELRPEVEPTLATALRPQTRVGDVAAQQIEAERAARSELAIPSEQEFLSAENVDLKTHIDFAEKNRLQELSNLRPLSEDEKNALSNLNEKLKGKEKPFDDISKYASFKGFKTALEKYYANESVARTKSLRQAADDVEAEILELEELMAIPTPIVLPSGPVDPRAGDARFKRHVIGEMSDDPGLYGALEPQIKTGYVPILSEIQKDYLRESQPIIRQAYVDVLPYQRQLERLGEYAQEEQEAELRGGGVPGTTVTVPPEDIIGDRPKPITMKEAEANYDAWLENAGVKDFYAIDFFSDPEKYAQTTPIVGSWWNKSYPTGASVEGPAQWGLRAFMAPFNAAGYLGFEAVRNRPEMQLIESALGVEEPTIEQRAKAGEDSLYINHPLLRNIAQNKGAGDNFYDLYWYNGYGNLAYVPGALGLIGEMLFVPADLGITSVTKGVTGVAKARKAAAAIGMPIRKSELAEEFARGALRAYADQSLVGPIINKIKKSEPVLLDPAEYGAARAADFLNGMNAYRLAKADALAKNLEPTHEDLLAAALEILGSGSRGNRFIDEATARGPEWTVSTIDRLGDEVSSVGREYNDYVNALARFITGQSDQIPNEKLTNRLLNYVLEFDDSLRAEVKEAVKAARAEQKVTVDPRLPPDARREIDVEPELPETLEETEKQIDLLTNRSKALEKQYSDIQRRDEYQDIVDEIDDVQEEIKGLNKPYQDSKRLFDALRKGRDPETGESEVLKVFPVSGEEIQQAYDDLIESRSRGFYRYEPTDADIEGLVVGLQSPARYESQIQALRGKTAKLEEDLLDAGKRDWQRLKAQRDAVEDDLRSLKKHRNKLEIEAEAGPARRLARDLPSGRGIPYGRRGAGKEFIRGRQTSLYEAFDAIRNSPNASIKDVFLRMTEPLSFRKSQSIISQALDASRSTRGAWRSLRMITPGLFVSEASVGKLGDLVGEDTFAKAIANAHEAGKIRFTNYAEFAPTNLTRQRNLPGGKPVAIPGTSILVTKTRKVGQVLELDDVTGRDLDNIVRTLADEGYLSSLDEVILRDQIRGQDISLDNLQRIVNANIERVAYNNKIGVTEEALETAPTVTKEALLDPVEARHLSQSWPRRLFAKLFDDVNKPTSWSSKYQEGMPLYGVLEMEKLRGKLASMDVVLRRDIKLLMKDKDMQQAYFSESWLKENKVTRDDAIVALALGTLEERSINTPAIFNNLVDIMTQKVDSTALNFMDVFRPVSVQRENLANSLSEDGAEALIEISDKYQGLFNGKSRQTINGAEDFTKFLADYHNDLQMFLENPARFADKTSTFQLIAPQFSDVTAGFYYVQQQKRLLNETLDNITRKWMGIQDTTKLERAFNPVLKVMADVENSIGDILKTIKVKPDDEAGDVVTLPGRGPGPRLVEEVVEEPEELPEGVISLFGARRPTVTDLEERAQEGTTVLPSIMGEQPSERTFGVDDLEDLKELEGDLKAMFEAADEEQMLGDMIARKIQTILYYRANPGVEFTLNRTPEEDWADVIYTVFGDDIASNPVMTDYFVPNLASLNTSVMKGEIPPGAIEEPAITKDFTWSPARALADFQSAQVSMFEAHDLVTRIANSIIKENNLNQSNLNENLTFLQSVFDKTNTALFGKSGTSFRFTEETVLNQLRSMKDDEASQVVADLILNTSLQKEVADTVRQVDQVRQVRQALSGLFETNQTAGYKVARAVDSTLTWINRMRYSVILGSRVSHHVTNVLTAPFIVWGTLGGRSAFESVSNSKTAIEIIASGVAPTKSLSPRTSTPIASQIAAVDPFGRKYTYQQVYDMALGGGALRSRTQVTISPTQMQEIMNDARFTPEYRNFVTRGLGKIVGAGGVQAAIGSALGPLEPGLAIGAGLIGASALPNVSRVAGRLQARATGISKFLTDMLEFEDQIFRLATVIGALKRGDDPAQALRAGARALLDYGDLNKQEKWAMSRFAMFYSFWRLNMANSMGLLLSDPKRFVNIARATQGGAQMLRALGSGGDMQYKTHELDFYKHSFLLSRPIVGFVEGTDYNTHYQAMPGIPALDIMETLAQILMAPDLFTAAEPLRGFIDPTIRAAIGKDPEFQWRKKYVDPRDMYVLDKTAWGDIFWDSFIKERPKGSPAKSGQETWHGQTWTLSKPAMKRYLYWKNYVLPFLAFPSVYTGDTLPLSLFVLPEDEMAGRRFGPGITDVLQDPTGTARSALGITGVVRDVGSLPVNKARIRALQEMTRRMQEIEKQRGVPSIKQLKSKTPKPK